MKSWKIILINIVALIFLLVVADYIFFNVEKASYLKLCNASDGFFDDKQIVHFAKEIPHSYIFIDEERSFDKKSDKSVLLLGCSYTYGANLNPNQTFSYYLSELTGRTVYNLGVCGGSIHQSLYLTGQDDFAKKYPNVDLVIYTFISDHLNRNNEFLKCYVFNPYCNFRFVKKGDEFVRPSEWYAFPSKIYLFRFFLEAFTAVKNSPIFYQKNCKNFVEMMNKTKDNIKKNYPNAKIVFFFYHCYEEPLLINNFDKDIYVLSTDDFNNLDLDNVKYRHGEDWHPSEKAWQEIVPILINKLHEIKYL